MNSWSYRVATLGLFLLLVLVPLIGTQAGELEQGLYKRLAASVASTDYTATTCESRQKLWIKAVELTANDLDAKSIDQYRKVREDLGDTGLMAELVKRIAKRLPVHPKLAELQSAGVSGRRAARNLSAYTYLVQGSYYWRVCFDDKLPKGQVSTWGAIFELAANATAMDMAFRLATCE